LEYNWQGNVRELRHTIEHACILCRQSVITIEHLPPEFKDTVVRQNPHVKNIAYDDPERMLKTLEKAGWNKSKAARMLGISVRTLYRKIEKFKIQPQRRQQFLRKPLFLPVIFILNLTPEYKITDVNH
jgi:DNA-binding NtrC family response regulator